MTTTVTPAGYAAARAVSTAGGGTALTTAPTVIALPPGTREVQIVPRNFSTAVAVQWALCPWLAVLKTTDAFAVAGNATDYSSAAQDADATTDVVLSSLATTGALWVGAAIPFRGLLADVDAANGNAATLSGTYWNGSTMADISLTDNTAVTSATFAQDGSITWTVPTAWTPGTLRSIASAVDGVPISASSLYWVKLVVSAALDSSTTLNSLLALCRSTAYAELSDGMAMEMAWHGGLGRGGGIELRTDAGTANAIVNALVPTGGRFL